MRRLAFALGTWQLAVLLACLDQVDESDEGTRYDDDLVLYGPGLPAQLKQKMDELARAGRTWRSITWADDILVKPDRPSRGAAPALTAELAARIGPGRVDQLWMCKLFDFPEKAVVEAYPDADIQLYEDGLHTYVFQPTVKGRAGAPANEIRSLGRRAARFTVGRGDAFWTPGIWGPHRARVSRVWLLPMTNDTLVLPTSVPDVERIPIGVSQLRGVLDSIRVLELSPGERGEDSRRPTMLVLGQAFHLFHLMSWQQEFTLYNDICRTSIEAGYDVLWKEHPRLEYGYFPALEAAQPEPERMTTVQMPQALPVEAGIDLLSPTAVVSGTSTSLFTISSLGSTAVYTFADRLRFPWYRRDHRQMAKLVAGSFPTVDRAWTAAAIPTGG